MPQTTELPPPPTATGELINPLMRFNIYIFFKEFVMKTNNRTWILAIAACAALAVVTGCPTGDGGGGNGVPPPVVDTSPVQTLAAEDVVIEITKTNTQPRAAAATGDYYWVYKADELINQGKVTVAANGNITFKSSTGSGSFTLKKSGDSYTLISGSIPNSKGPPISSLPNFGVPKSIKITGFNLTGYSDLFVFVSETPQPIYSQDAEGNWLPERGIESRAAISGPDITVKLAPTYWDESAGQVHIGDPWTGSGTYYLWLQISPEGATGPGLRRVYVYAVNGTSPVAEGAEADYNADGIVPIDIKDAVTTLEFSKFVYRGHDPTAG